MADKTAKQRYEELKLRRQPFLDRAWEYAELTIPSLLPRYGHNYTRRMVEPYQALGSRLVVNLASQLGVALLPAGTAFFELSVPAEVLIQAGTTTPPADITKKLAMASQLIMSEIERRAWRNPTNVALLLLIVTGNVLEQVLPNNRLRLFKLDQYVVVRDYEGNVLEIVLEENISPLSLPEAAKGLIPQNKMDDASNNVCLYTWVRRDGEVYRVHQEIEDKRVPNTDGEYPLDKCPFSPVRWSIVPGEDYGRGKCEEHGGDLRTYEALSKSLLDGAAMAARHIMLVKPNATGTNLKSRLAKANNGDVVIGNEEDIAMLKFDNVANLQLIQAELQRLAENLSAAFMLRAGVVRDSERTTALEVRMVAEELEGGLGGTYSMLSEDMMRKRLERLILQMKDNGQLPDWPDNAVEPKIIVGLDALNREKDVMRVQAAAQIAQVLDPKQEYTKTGDLLTTAFVGLGLPAAVRSDQEVMENRKQMAQMEAATQAGGKIAQSVAQQ